jgi:hypothetical protein
MVVQFGGRISDKPRASIEKVMLDVFENGGTAEVVRHGRQDAFGLQVPEASAADVVIDRSLWLLKNHPPGRYNLLGHNCESMANWCATGWYSESNQSRGILMMIQLCIVMPIFFLIPPLVKRGKISHRNGRIFTRSVIVTRVLLFIIWFRNWRRFVADFSLRWLAYEEYIAGKIQEPEPLKLSWYPLRRLIQWVEMDGYKPVLSLEEVTAIMADIEDGRNQL